MRGRFPFNLAMGLAALCALAAPAAAQEDFYEGKTLTIVVGLGAGGTSDTFARNFSTYLQKYIPGNPNVVVQNMPGGAGLRATNYIFELAEPDGLTILWGPWDPLAQALKVEEMRARYQDFEFIGGTGDIRVNYSRRDIVPGDIEKPADIVKATDPVLIGESSTTGASGLLARMSLDVLGVPNALITGYDGGSGVYAGILRGEVHLQNTSIGTLRTRSRDFLESGEGIPLWYFVGVDADGNYEKSPHIDDIPVFPEVYQAVHGEMPSGPMWEALNWYTNQIGEMTFVALAPPGTPEEVVAVLRTAYDKAMNDPEFTQSSIERNGLPYSYVAPAKGEAVFEALATASPEVLKTMQEVIEPSGD